MITRGIDAKNLIISPLFALAVIVCTALMMPCGFGADVRAATENLSPFRACGLNCLFVVAKMNNIATTLPALEKEIKPRANGDSSIADLERAALKLGLEPISVRVDETALHRLPLPAIVHLKTRARQSDSSHYVVLIGLHPRGVILIDPPAGATLHPYAEFAEEWTGVAIAFPENQLSGDRLMTLLRRQDFWSVWPVRLAGVVVVGALAWLPFRGENWSGLPSRMLSTLRGAQP